MGYIRALALVGALLTASAPLYAQSAPDLFRPEARLVASDGVSGNQFGAEVAVDGDTALIVAPGAVYVFVRRANGVWEEVAKLTPSDPGAAGSFGRGAAIDGDTAVVGAADADAAFVFSRNQGGPDAWGEIQKLVATGGAAGSGFGSSVALDGDTAVIGASGEDDISGAAYVFSKGTSGTWTEAARLSASDRAEGDSFGASVSVSGSTIVVGAPLKADPMFPNLPRGSAYVFSRQGAGAWSEVARLAPEDPLNPGIGSFGFSVAVDGDIAVVGAPGSDVGAGSAHIFERDHGGPGAWREVFGIGGRMDCEMGSDVDISSDLVIVTEGSFDLDCDSRALELYSRNQGGPNVWGRKPCLKRSPRSRRARASTMAMSSQATRSTATTTPTSASPTC